MTVQGQKSAVQELVAEGFGTTTVVAAPTAVGWGEWRDGSWAVTVARPLQAGTGRSNLPIGRTTHAAFAVWDGADGQAGSRKMRSGWVPLLLEAGR